MTDLEAHPTTPGPTRDVLEAASSETVLFVPAIKDHKAWFLGETPSNISRDPELLTRAMLAEYEALGSDALTVGVDNYNTEAEAVGCRVTFYEDGDTSIPGIAPGNHCIDVGDDLTSAPIPNPLTDGRMPVNIETARRVARELDGRVWIRGAVSGPFSLAVSLMGPEKLFLTTIDDPDCAHRLLDYAVRIVKVFGRAYLDVGVGPIIFDSQASADLLSPDMYHEFCLPRTTELVEYFKEQGAEHIPLILGGNTTPIVEDLLATGANNLMCDYPADWSLWLEACRESGRAVRRNLDPAFIVREEPETIYEAARKAIEEAGAYPGFIMGSSVISFGTPTEKLLAVRQACRDAVRAGP